MVRHNGKRKGTGSGAGNGKKDIYINGKKTTDSSIYMTLMDTGAYSVTDNEIPVPFTYSCACIHNDRIHILGSYESGYRTIHYSTNGDGTWREESSLPYDFYYGDCISYNGEIHIFGGAKTGTSHYKWNETDGWVSVSTLPYTAFGERVLFYKDKIHMMGGYNGSARKAHYTWTEEEGWLAAEALIEEFYYASAIVFQDKIHLFGSYSKPLTHYVLEDDGWVAGTTMVNYCCWAPTAIDGDGLLHIYGGGSSSTCQIMHVTYDGTTMTNAGYCPNYLYGGRAIYYHDRMYILGNYSTATKQTVWRVVNTYRLIPM